MKSAILIVLTFFNVFFACAQNQPKTLLWKVTKKGSKNVSYLFGTFHEVTPRFFDSLPNAMEKLKQSSILFVEQRNASQTKFTLKKTWTHEKWKTLLTTEQEKIFSSFITKSEDSSYYKLNPLLLSLTMARLYLVNFCETGAYFSELMDNHIEGLAVKENKTVYSLDLNQTDLLNETSGDLTPAEDSLYAAFGVKYMKSMLENDLQDCKIISDYKNLNIDYQLEEELKATAADFQLLVERNTNWVSRLLKYFPANNCFVAVGFRHLFYKQGLIQKLRDLGYEVVPVPIRP